MKQSKHRPLQTQGDKSIAHGFIADINHVIRKEMDAIIEMTGLTLNSDLDEKQRAYLEKAMMSADALVGFLNEVVDLSNIETHQFRLEQIDFNLRNTLDCVSETLSAEMKKAGHRLTWRMTPDVPMSLVGDPGRLRQIMVNLLRYALPFISEEAVTVHLEIEKRDKVTIDIHFTIGGIGVGVSRNQIGMLFEHFRPVDDFSLQEWGSKALSLSLSRKMVKMMGGRIWLESDLGNGNSLHFTARFGLSRARNAKTTKLGAVDFSNLRVLIVDDNEINRLVFKGMIISKGVLTAEATNGAEAIEKAEEAFNAGEPYQIILLDLQMPGMDGFEVARKLKACQFGERVQIVLLTSVGQKGDAAMCREVGISGYLLKPVKQQELLDAIALLLSDPPSPNMQVITRFTIQEARRKLERPFKAAK